MKIYMNVFHQAEGIRDSMIELVFFIRKRQYVKS